MNYPGVLRSKSYWTPSLRALTKKQGEASRDFYEGAVRGEGRKPERNVKTELKGGKFQRQVNGQ